MTINHKIIQRAPCGDRVRIWDNIQKPADYFKVTYGAILMALDNKTKRCCGHYWEVLIDEIEGEEWKIDIELGIEISNLGNIRTAKTKRSRALVTTEGYKGVYVKKKRLAVHRLVAKHFLPSALDLSLIHISEPTRLLSISYAV